MAALSVLVIATEKALADGIFRNGVGARSMAMGGADDAYAADPLGAMAANPAGLGFLSAGECDLSLNAASAYGQFTKPGVSQGPLDNSLGFFPDAAFAMPVGNLPISVGLSFVSDSVSTVNWGYDDPKSSSGITYGFQDDRAQILLLRTALGVGAQILPWWSVGGDIGIVYNRNNLETPYIFQNAPGLAGAKVLLDLNTSGVGVNGEFGTLIKVTDDLQFGLTYRTITKIYTDGTALGDAGVQLGQSSYPFQYDAKVKNILPQMATIGGSWKIIQPLRLALQVDWINWKDAFTQLPVSLHSGTSTKPMVLPTTIYDSVPLNWRNELVYRAGLEYAATTNVMIRAGYCYGGDPVPDNTLTPLNAAITENTVTTGLGYAWSRYKLEFAYQWDIPVTRHIGTSALQAGEYSQSSIQVGAQTFTLTAGVKF